VSAAYRVVATDRVSKKGLAPLREDGRFNVIRFKDSSDPAFVTELGKAAPQVGAPLTVMVTVATFD